MRKFVVKNRKKRKYTKKSEEIQSLSFAKNAYGMMPFIVMAIAFMATLIISSPFRNIFSHIHFSFQPPELSFSNPISFFQSVAFAISEFAVASWAMLIAIASAITITLGTAIHAISQIVVALGNILILLGEFLINAVRIAENGIISVSYSLWQLCNIVGSFVLSVLSAIGVFFAHVITIIVQTLVTVWIIISQTVFTIITAIAHFVTDLALTIVHFISMIFVAIGMWLYGIWVSIATAFTNTSRAIEHEIEIPFKTLAIFMNMLRPYVDILGKHVQMTGSDLTNGFASWGKVATLISPSK